MIKYFSICLCILFFACSNSFEGYKKHKEGFYSQLIEFDDSKKLISQGCFVQFNWAIVSNKDTIFQNRHGFEIKEINQNSGIIEALSYLHESEKAKFIFPFYKIEPEFKNLLNQISLKDSSDFIHIISIDKIYSSKEYALNKKHFNKWIKNTKNLDYKSFEQHLILHYLKNQDKTFKKTASGLYFKLISGNKGEKITNGKPIKLKYTGGPILNNNNRLEKTLEQDFNVGQELQVIKAIEETITHMCYGDSAVVLAPSSLAFGEKGSSTGIIPPFSPVVYYIKVEK